MGRLVRFLLVAILGVAVVLAGFRLVAHLREADVAGDVAPDDGRYVETELGGLFAIQRGGAEAPAVLLIHGSVGWSGVWRHTLDRLAMAGFRALAIDLPPMGYSDRDPAGDYSRAASAERILAFVRAEGMRPHIVAHSFGAGAAVEAVMRDPDAFASLTIVNGALPLDPDGSAVLPTFLRPVWLREVAVSATVTNPLVSRRLLQAFLFQKDAATDALLEVLTQPGTLEGATEALAIWMPTLLVPPVDLASVRSEALQALDLPVALIWGAEDTTTPLAQGENLAALIPGARLHVMHDVGHIPMIEDPAAFDAALVEALEAVSTP